MFVKVWWSAFRSSSRYPDLCLPSQISVRSPPLIRSFPASPNNASLPLLPKSLSCPGPTYPIRTIRSINPVIATQTMNDIDGKSAGKFRAAGAISATGAALGYWLALARQSDSGCCLCGIIGHHRIRLLQRDSGPDKKGRTQGRDQVKHPLGRRDSSDGKCSVYAIRQGPEIVSNESCSGTTSLAWYSSASYA